MIIFAIIHELAHLVAGILLGFKPDKLELIPVGLTVSFRVNLDDFMSKLHNGNKLILKEIIVALAGPLINILITIIAFFINIDCITMKFFDCHNLVFTINVNICRCNFSDAAFHDQFCLPLAASF